jgi:hypothetical protein
MRASKKQSEVTNMPQYKFLAAFSKPRGYFISGACTTKYSPGCPDLFGKIQKF